MNRLSVRERAQILGFLVEGNSMRAASRMADVSINTVTKLLVDVGTACGELPEQDPPQPVLASASSAMKFGPLLCQGKGPSHREARRSGIWRRLHLDCHLCRHEACSQLLFVGRRTVEHGRLFVDDPASRLLNSSGRRSRFRHWHRLRNADQALRRIAAKHP
jgi:hypothetical protein